jgi:predicted transcriptional regulator
MKDAPTFHQLNEQRVESGIVSILNAHGPMSGDGIARKLDMCRTRVFDRALKSLLERGEIARTGERRTTVYSLAG